MLETYWLQKTSPAFRLMIATSWLAPDSWEKNQEEAIRAAVGAGPDWTEYLRLVDRHRTPALSWAALSRVPGFVIPESAMQELERRNRACRVQGIRHCRQLAKIMKAFNHARIPVMALKGPILSFELYGDAGLRQSSDLDLAIVPDNVCQAKACLNDLGWHLDPTFLHMTPRQWEEFWKMKDDLVFIHAEPGSRLEIHTRIHRGYPEQNSYLWTGGIPSIWQGCSYYAMNPIDQVLYLCSHGGDHAWFRAKWLGDLARVRAQGRVDWEAVLERATNTGLNKPLLACLQLLRIVYELPVPKPNGSHWNPLPAFLIHSPLRALLVSKEPPERGALVSIPDLLYAIRYPRQILPSKTWRQSFSELLYCRRDFGIVRLPDSLFWVYAPLRPFLFAWRKLTQNLKS